VQIQVFQGERRSPPTTRSSACSSWPDRAPPRGVPQIEVTFDIDANGIVNVSAKDLGTGKQQSVQISGGPRWARTTSSKMAGTPRVRRGGPQRREEAEVRNQADSLVYQTEKFLGENEDKVPEDIKSEVRERSPR
jgi:Molecular chaperone